MKHRILGLWIVSLLKNNFTYFSHSLITVGLKINANMTCKNTGSKLYDRIWRNDWHRQIGNQTLRSNNHANSISNEKKIIDKLWHNYNSALWTTECSNYDYVIAPSLQCIMYWKKHRKLFEDSKAFLRNIIKLRNQKKIPHLTFICSCRYE